MVAPKYGCYQEIFKRANQMWRADGSPPGRLKYYLERSTALLAINPEPGHLPDRLTPVSKDLELSQNADDECSQDRSRASPSDGSDTVPSEADESWDLMMAPYRCA